HGVLGLGVPSSLASLTTDAGAGTILACGAVFTTGGQTYNNAVTLVADTTLFAGLGGVTFAGAVTVSGAYGLTVNTEGDTVFFGAVGTMLAPLASLTTDVAGITNISGGSVWTSGAQSYGDAVMLGASTLLTTTAGGGVGFGSVLTGRTPLGQNLTVHVGSGDVTFGGA